MQIKICGITRPDQAVAIAQLGATALGFICVPTSPRYVTPGQIRNIAQALQAHPQTAAVQRIGVFVDASADQVCDTLAEAQLTGAQLHGSESPQTCRRLRQLRPDIELIKAFRLRSPASLPGIEAYGDSVDALLLDAFHPSAHGGTGKTLNWAALQNFRPQQPWFLAGGLTPDNVTAALTQLQPSGIDLSSGVEDAPGQKNLDLVRRLFSTLRDFRKE
ncbi:MAG: phosphoribosylanthranilate isomerase [Elainellaceae cyanobacterium]